MTADALADGPVATPLVVEVNIQGGNWPDGAADIAADAGRAAFAIAGDGEPASVSVALMDDAAIRVLNRDYRGKDSPTNVLSFPLDDDAGFDGTEDDAALGDIAVAWETVDREAAEAGRSLDDHLRHMMVHGVLHLLGYDHENDDDAEEMEGLERQVLATLGVADPYADSDPDGAAAVGPDADQ